MELNRENLEQWKKELNLLMKPHYGDNFTEVITDEMWIQYYEGCTPLEAYESELECFED